MIEGIKMAALESMQRRGFVKHFPGVDHEKGYPMKFIEKRMK
jgi:hypothetical protein